MKVLALGGVHIESTALVTLVFHEAREGALTLDEGAGGILTLTVGTSSCREDLGPRVSLPC